MAPITSVVEQHYIARSGYTDQTGRMPYVIVDNFPELGLLTAMRFLEWVSENPEGVISLPTGKTPEYFINWTQKLLAHWGQWSTILPSTHLSSVIPAKAGTFSPPPPPPGTFSPPPPPPGTFSPPPDLPGTFPFTTRTKPDLRGLSFVQMDDFYPISPNQLNSFYYYVKEFYINGLGLDAGKALLINSKEIPLYGGSYSKIFPGLTIDLSLRHREPANHLEEVQQKSVFMIDSWCMEYEQRIRDLGGIGFFLGGIGPDGHIAFNIKGSDHHSTTRLSPTNYATQAAAAGDLGGIEVSGKRHVLTIGLGTITMNPDTVAIIFAAGETKAPVVRAAIEQGIDVQHPASVLQKLPNARFYLTQGAAKQLTDVRNRYFMTGGWTIDKSIHTLLEYCQVNNVYAHKISQGNYPPPGPLPQTGRGSEHGLSPGEKPLPSLREGLGWVPPGRLGWVPPGRLGWVPPGRLGWVPPASPEEIATVLEEVKSRLARGSARIENKVILHTGPHHDDIMLGLMPLVNRQLRASGNKVHFAVATSGFTALSNRYLIDRLQYTIKLMDQGEIQMLDYPDFFANGYLFKWDKDVSHYLNKVGARDEEGKYRGLSHRIVRCMVKIWNLANRQQLHDTISEVISLIKCSYDGEKNPPEIQRLKGMIREFEEELVWAHSGIQVKDVHHLRLGFYKGDIFTEQPEEERDVKPIADLLNELNPDIISVTMDPEGSGPDTHYKVLQATAKAIDAWRSASAGNKQDVKIIGYRNVWYRYHPAEANVYVPVSLNSLAVMQNSFRQCYLSQLDASFPSPELNGPFCDLAQKVWVDQLKDIQLLLGKDYFYENERPLIRATHGLIFYKELTIDEFLAEAIELARRTE